MNNSKMVKAGALLLTGLLTVALAGCDVDADAEPVGETKTVTAKPEVVTETVEVEKVVEVEVAPAVCADALAAGDQVIGYSSDIMGILSDAMTGPVIDAVVAASTNDAAGLDRASGEIEQNTLDIDEINADLAASEYLELKEACLAAVK